MENNDWTDILYIIVAVIFGIIGKLAQRKAKPAQRKTEVPQPEEVIVESPDQLPGKGKAESIFDTIYETVFDEDISTPSVETMEEEPITKEKIEEKIAKEAEPEVKGLDALLKKRHEEEEREEAEREQIEFDLREAVIYSEILNKKYN